MFPIKYLREKLAARGCSPRNRCCADFPFLRNKKSFRYICRSKVLFVMRGLPGSGKSFLANQISRRYRRSNFICSADYYFNHPDGKYVHEQTKLRDAHKYCQETCKKAMLIEKKHIIIDNTNIHWFEIQPYLNLARSNNYLTLIVEPKTAWKFDVNVLSANNTHGYSVEDIEEGKDQFIDIKPNYYAFFLNEFDSKYVRDFAKNRFLECISLFPDFAKNFTQTVSKTGEVSLYETYYNIDKDKILHCTTCFITPDTSSYSSNDSVVKSVGKYFNLLISGFIFTPRVAAVVIKLKKSQLKLWNSEDKFSYIEDDHGHLIPSKANHSIYQFDYSIISNFTKNPEHKLETNVDDNIQHESPSTDVELNIKDKDNNELFLEFTQPQQPTKDPMMIYGSIITLKKGSRSHLTIGTHGDVQNVQSGFDLLSLKYKYKKGLFEEIVYQNDFSYIKYGDDECEVKFNWPMPVGSLFAGDYAGSS